MAYPTTLALITALWSEPREDAGRSRSWSALGGAIAALGPLVAGALLEEFDWGSVFLVTLPLAGLALVLAFLFVAGPRERDVGSRRQPRRDPVRGCSSERSSSGSTSLRCRTRERSSSASRPSHSRALVGFYIRQRRAENPLYDLNVASRRVFWVAACAGIIVFGSLMGAAFISQQYLQNVLGYSTLEAGAVDPARGARDGPRRAAGRPSSSRPVAPVSRSSAVTSSSVLAFVHDARPLGRGRAVLAGRARVRVHRSRGRSRRDPGVAFADRLGAR